LPPPITVPPIELDAEVTTSNGFKWITWPEGSDDFYYRKEGSGQEWVKR